MAPGLLRHIYANGADAAARSPRKDYQVLLNNPGFSTLRLILAMHCLGSAMHQHPSINACFLRLCQHDRRNDHAAAKCQRARKCDTAAA